MYQYYNVFCFTPNPKSVLRNVLARLVNCLIKALNNAKKMPRMIIIIPENDLVEYLSHKNFDMKVLANKALNWVMNQMVRAVDAKIDNLRLRCPGAIVTTEPKFIWVEMFNRVTDFTKLPSVRHKYIEALQEQIRKRTRHYIIDINESMMDTSLFDMANQLNGRGTVHFWNQIDDQIKSFDYRKISLKPPKQVTTSSSNDKSVN